MQFFIKPRTECDGKDKMHLARGLPTLSFKLHQERNGQQDRDSRITSEPELESASLVQAVGSPSLPYM
ncbi:MAG TPA: hypothetical protein VMT42_03885 [candidate division Zixibacteria bacterium]|nr:hypothetical protein [candidate division Zixibacteria bacterium]